MNGQNLTVLISHDVNDILNSKVQANKGTIFKAAVTLEVSKALGIEYHLHCSWRPQFSGQKKVEKASSIQFSLSVVSDSLRPHESQHSRSPCPSPTPGVHSDSRPSSQ